MNTALNDLVKSVTRKASLSECSVSELEKLVAQYPYFAPAQFLLAQKLKLENSPQYSRQAQKALLYIQDQLWFDYLSRAEDSSAQLVSGPAHNTDEQATADTNTPAPVSIPDSEIPIEPFGSDRSVDELSAAAEPDLTVESAEQSNELQERAAEPDSFISAPAVTETSETKEPDPAEQNNELQEMSAASDSFALPSAETETEPDTSETKEPDLPPLPSLKIEPISEKALSFEPYHTVDYFASQGIRMQEEGRPKDRFSQQLKSFTEWLKTMKRLPESELTVPPPAAVDAKVTTMAEHSLVDREVVTEAMAEVWEKQGNALKAIEIYKKLSLLDPSKSAYFAARIEKLKTP
jgi:hypothetical protein